MAPLRWLITGSSAGFGLALSLHVLSQGHTVAATVRSRTRSADAVRQLEAAGAHIVELDVNEAAAAPRAIKDAEAALGGPISVLVNNAGYSVIGALEDLTDAECLKQFETNFFGPRRLIQAVLPSMRAAKAGTIVNVSSTSGHDGLPSCSMYSASKFALEGMSEALSREVEPWGISVIVAVPGAFRTNFQSALQLAGVGISAPYKQGPVEAVWDRLNGMIGKQPGDPAEGAARIFEVVTGQGMAGALKGKVFRLLLGADSVDRLTGKVTRVKADIEASRAAAVSTGFA